MTGGVTGVFNSGYNAASFILGGVKALSLSGTQTILQNAGVDSLLSQTLLTIGSPLANGIQTGTIAGSVVKIVQDLPRNLSNYGLQTLGSSLGLSPLVSQMIAAPVSTSLSSGINNGNTIGQNLIQSIKQSTILGAVTYGLELAGQSHPMLGSLLSQDLVKGVATAIGRSGIFDKALDFLGKTAMNAFNVVGGSIQGLFNGISSFTQEIQEKGLAQALQDNLQALFGRAGQEAFIAKGGAQVIASLPRTSVTLPNGQQAQEAKIDANHSLYFDSQGKLIGKKEKSEVMIGEFGKNSAAIKVALTNGKSYAGIDGYQVAADISGGEVMVINVYDQEGQEVARIDGSDANTSIKIEGPRVGELSATFWDSVIELVSYGTAIKVENGVANAAEIAVSVSQSAKSQNTLYALVNGILNTEWDPKNSPDYINNFESDIAANPLDNISSVIDFMKSSIYQGFGTPLDMIKDVTRLAWEASNSFVHGLLTQKIIADFNAQQVIVDPNQSRPIVAMGYSGGLLPLVEAIRQEKYNTTTLIGLGAATTSIAGMPFEKIGEITALMLLGNYSQAAGIVAQFMSGVVPLAQTNLKRFVNVWGTEDILLKFGIAGKRDSFMGLPTYNIEIAGATHFDYMRRSNEPDPVKADFNKRVSQFVAGLTIASNNDTDLNAYLIRTIGVADPDGVWRFHP